MRQNRHNDLKSAISFKVTSNRLCRLIGSNRLQRMQIKGYSQQEIKLKSLKIYRFYIVKQKKNSKAIERTKFMRSNANPPDLKNNFLKIRTNFLKQLNKKSCKIPNHHLSNISLQKKVLKLSMKIMKPSRKIKIRLKLLKMMIQKDLLQMNQ